MDHPEKREITFAIHSVDAMNDPLDRGVSAGVFATKLGAVVRALEAASKSVNGFPAFTYVLSHLHMSTPTAVLREDYSSYEAWDKAPQSGVEAFEQCADAIAMGDKSRADAFGSCVKEIRNLTAGAKKKFGYAEIKTSESNVIRVDDFLRERTVAIYSGREVVTPPSDEWFKGAVFGSFTGSVLEADLRGWLPQIKLVLSAGGKEIDCVCRREDIELIRSALNARVTVSGRAIYDGRSGLPRRLQVRDIERLAEPVDFESWKGSLEPFEPLPWDGDTV